MRKNLGVGGDRSIQFPGQIVSGSIGVVSKAPKQSKSQAIEPSSISVQNGGRTQLDRQAARLIGWCEDRTRAFPDLYYWPELRAPASLSAAEKAQNKATLSLFKKTFKSFLWSGFECSNPLIDRRDRWDQNEIAGLYDPEKRSTQVKMLRDVLGIENARVGLPNHLVAPHGEDAPYVFEPFDRIMADLRSAAKNGKVKISLDLMHFGLPDRFHVEGQPEKSDFLHPEWPAHFAELSVATVKRYPDVEAITLINEPFVTNNFSGSHWNEAVDGDKAFIERALNMGDAATLARTKIEEHLQATKTRKLFLHNDSCEYRSDDPAFSEYKRFLTSDLILGADWLLSPSFRVTPMFSWLAQQYGDADALASRLSKIREAHLEFSEKFGKSMKADTVFGMDYYVTCERGPGISHSADGYLKEAQRTRKGLYEMGMDYFGRYRLPLIHAETNIREEVSVGWMTQQLVELSALMKSGVPVLGATWYSLMDQAGWENGLGSPVLRTFEDAKKAGRVNPIGLVNLENGEPRAVAGMLQQLSTKLADPPAQTEPKLGRRRAQLG